MTREEIEKDYNVVNGIIRSPGKFEGEMVYVPHFWNLYLEGCADRDDGRVLGFDINGLERAMFPELKRRRTIKLACSEDGFVGEL